MPEKGKRLEKVWRGEVRVESIMYTKDARLRVEDIMLKRGWSKGIPGVEGIFVNQEWAGCVPRRHG